MNNKVEKIGVPIPAEVRAIDVAHGRVKESYNIEFPMNPPCTLEEWRIIHEENAAKGIRPHHKTE